MKHRATSRRAAICAGQRIDTDTFLEGFVWPNTFDDDDVWLQAIERPQVDDDAGELVTEPNPITLL